MSKQILVSFRHRNETNDPNTAITSGGERDNENEGDNDKHLELPAKKQMRFELTEECPQTSWELPPNLLEYVHKYISVHVADKDIKANILQQNPATKNVKKVPPLDI